ncbi:2'-5' RNA ligase family protein [Clostridium sp.]|uniref:2'-5' RNA ligase family protein n=1 Tax=Clostridium sp. TaxID=1506 RepID=UPI002FC76463
MKERFLCIMAQFDKATEEKLSSIYKTLFEAGFVGNQTPNLPYHITLGTFELDKESELKELVRKVGSNTPKLQISFNHIGLFGMEVLFVTPSISHELLNLQQKFNNNYANDLCWSPHTTIIIDEPAVIEKSIPIVAENFSSLSGYIESISLYEFWPTRFITEEKLI